MKKLLLIVLFVFIFCFVIIYFFIPDQLSISRGVTVNASSKGILRALTEKNKWQQWWPDDAQNIHFKSSNFRPEQQLMNRVAIDIVTEGNPVKGIIT
ncbi:MAG TPA: hypothetical protein VM368_00265, partial [Flavisolibacter sp.]|nr:hypothetical protein [Flavisolibacter sp.]